MFQPTLQFHRLTGVRLGPIQHFPASETGAEFWCRRLTLTGADGMFEVPLFSGTADGLKTPAELDAEAVLGDMAKHAREQLDQPARLERLKAVIGAA